MAAVAHDRRDERWSWPSASVPVGDGRPRPAVAGAGPAHRPASAGFALIVVAALAALGGWLVDGVAAGPVEAPPRVERGEGSPSLQPGTHVVQPGDTYWSLALSLGGPGDVRSRVDALQETNGGRVLHVGDHVELAD